MSARRFEAALCTFVWVLAIALAALCYIVPANYLAEMFR